jgi:2-dehydropantoate 2-reductase
LKIAVVGAGAMGCLFGSKMALVGHEVTMVDVVKAQVDAINTNGLIMESENGKQVINMAAKFANEIQEPVDLILLFTKSNYSREALKSAVPFIGKNTYIMSLQNGLGNDDIISEFVPLDRIIVGVTKCSSDLVEPGHIRCQSAGYIKFMSVNGQHSDMLQAIHESMLKSGLNSQITSDVFIDIWEKVAFNAAINSASAATRLSCGGIGGVQEGRDLIEAIVTETVNIANARGVAARKDAVMKSIEDAYTVHKDHLTSMAQDILRKRVTEVPAINGAIVREAEKAGLEAPVTKVLYWMMRILEQTYDKQVFELK